MIEKLEQITLSQFIDVLCGDMSVLTDNQECDGDRLPLVVRDMVLEFRTIADPGGTASYYKHMEEWIKAKIMVIIFTMCHNLFGLKRMNRVREILEEFGMSHNGWTDSRIGGTIQAKLAQAKRELDDLEKENETSMAETDNIRTQFDAQIASVMAHFKFQIDPSTIKATLYAHLLARYNREMKAQMAAMKKI